MKKNQQALMKLNWYTQHLAKRSLFLSTKSRNFRSNQEDGVDEVKNDRRDRSRPVPTKLT